MVCRPCSKHSLCCTAESHTLQCRQEVKAPRRHVQAKTKPHYTTTLADFQAVLRTYKPTKVKADEFAARNEDRSAAAFMASLFANYAGSNGANGANHDDKEDAKLPEQVD